VSTMRVTTLKNESSTIDQIVLNADGSFGGELNDVLGSKVDYPSGGADGNALIKDGTSAVWGNAGAGVVLASEAITASSNFAIDGVFSAGYHLYSIYYTLQPSTSLLHSIRLRASGSAATGANYEVQRLSATSGTVTNSVTSGATSAFLTATSTTRSAGQINMAYVFSAVSTLWQAQDHQGSGFTGINSWAHLLSTSYDGFEINTSTGTTTGHVTVVGYPV
jgi:hypothetical protein